MPSASAPAPAVPCGLRDGVKYKGDFGETVATKLNKIASVKGNAANKDDLTDGNIGVIASADGENAELLVKLNKDLDLGENGSVKMGDTSINNEGLKIANGPSITNTGINAGNKTISGVAAGKKGTDAVNVDQLKAARTTVASADGSVRVKETEDANGGKHYDLSVDGKDVQANIQPQLDHLENKLNAGIASAMATATVPQAYLPGKSMVALGAAYYEGETGYALGVSSISDNGKWIVKGVANANSRGKYGASVGLGYQW